MKAWVTGATGNLGVPLIHVLASMGHAVSSKYVQIQAYDEVRKFVEEYRPDVVFHLAAIVGRRKCSSQNVFSVNAEGTKNIAKACSEFGAKVVFASTDMVFDGRVGKCNEDDETCSVSRYGQSKIRAENFILKSDVIVRMGMLISRRTTFPDNSTNEVVTPLYIWDAAKELAEIGCDPNSFGVYHLCSASPIMQHELASMFVGRLAATEKGSKESYLVSTRIPSISLSETLKNCFSNKHDFSNNFREVAYGPHRSAIHVPTKTLYFGASYYDISDNPDMTYPVQAYLPTELGVMLGDKCNANCTMCWQATRRKNQDIRPEMDAGMLLSFLKLYDTNLRSIELCSWGEPLLYYRISEVLQELSRIRRLREFAGFQPLLVHMVTNGSLDLSQLAHFAGMLSISIDSPDPIKYSEIRRGLKLSVIEKNISDFVMMDLHPERVVGVNMVITERNKQDIPQMAQFCKGLGVQMLTLLKGENLANTDDKDSFLVDDSDLGKLVEEASTYLPVRDWIKQHQCTTQEKCLVPFKSMYIGSDGHCHPCCRSFDIDYQMLNENPWQSRTAIMLRDQMFRNELDPKIFATCVECRRIRNTKYA